MIEHSAAEIALTLGGVILLALAHRWNGAARARDPNLAGTGARP